MTVATLTKTLKGFDAEWTVPIWRILSGYSPTLLGGATQNQVIEIAHEISQVSGGAGLDILAVLMWPEDEMPAAFDDAKARIEKALINYVPGNAY